jgi:hypothetical protein
MHEVGQKRANAFGLYDMLGNVWEWVNDWYDQNYYQNSPSQDPTGPASGQKRVLHGGSWLNGPRSVRVSLRNGYNPGSRNVGVGFRCGGEVFAPSTTVNEAITKTEDDRHGSPPQTETTGPDLTVIDWQLTPCEHGSQCIVGTVRNNSDKEFSWGKVEFNLYDSNGAQVGSAVAVESNLEAHGTWKFRTLVPEREAATARLKYVIGW